jgi:hypothetical protein
MAGGPAPSSSLLRRLLVAAGYRVDDAGGVTVALREVDHRAVVIASRARSPVELGERLPPTVVHRTIVYDGEPPPAARDAAAAHGFELLDPSTLGPGLGEMLLPSALVPGASDGTAPEEDLLESPFPPIGAGARTVRPRVDRRGAQALAGLPGAQYTLRLVPYYVAAYRVRSVSANGGPGPVLRRLVAVNATTRRPEIWTEGVRELVAEVEGPSERLAPQLPEAGAAPIAVEAIRRQHTARVDHLEQHAGAIVVESRRVAPAAADVRLGPFSLLFVPYWYAESADGRRVLDAVSGRPAAPLEPADA